MNNQNIQLSQQPNHKAKAIISLVLGAIAVIIQSTLFLPVIFPSSTAMPITLFHGLIFVAVIFAVPLRPLILFVAIVGIILGLLGLKSIKKKTALAGIGLSIISLIICFLSIQYYGPFWPPRFWG